MKHGPTRVMVDVYGATPRQAAFLVFSLLSAGRYGQEEIESQYEKFGFVVHGETGALSV